MTYPTSVLRNATQKLKQRQEENKQITREKKERIYQQLPQLREINRKIATLLMNTVANNTSITETKKELEQMMLERNRILMEHGYDTHYLEDYFECPLCRDEGFVNGEPCECYQKLIREEAYLISNLAHRIQTENFGTFSLDIHSERRYIESIVQKAKQYCKKESSVKKNLLFSGPTGTGKSFLSSCIAKEFLDSGHFVLYLSATKMAELLEAQKFRREDTESLEYAQYVETCDLLILDDLGTEYAFGYPQSRMFDLLEQRMIDGKRTVISTNLSLNELNQKYSPRFVSRILGNYEILIFKGDDLRYRSANN